MQLLIKSSEVDLIFNISIRNISVEWAIPPSQSSKTVKVSVCCLTSDIAFAENGVQQN